MDLPSSAKILDIAIDKGAIPLLAFGVGFALKPTIRKIKAHWFRLTSSRYAAVFSDLEKETLTIQAGEPYFRFQDIRLNNTPYNLKLGIPNKLKEHFSAQELTILKEQDILFDNSSSDYLRFKNHDDLIAFLSDHFGVPIKEYLPPIIQRVAKDFASMSNGCLFNGNKYGILDYRVARTNDEKEFPILNLYCFDTDYFTDRVFTELWKSLPSEVRNKHSELSNQRSVAFLSCSLGINCVVICADDKLLITQRSTRVGLSTNQKHISMNEGLTQTDRDTGDVPSIRLCLLRGLREELGIRETDILKMEIGDFFLERNHFQFGLTSVVHLATGSQELRHAISKDRTLESDSFIFVDFHDTKELLKLLKSSRLEFVPHGYYTLLRILLREQPSIIQKAR
jgi:hypothetical protein